MRHKQSKLRKTLSTITDAALVTSLGLNAIWYIDEMRPMMTEAQYWIMRLGIVFAICRLAWRVSE